MIIVLKKIIKTVEVLMKVKIGYDFRLKMVLKKVEEGLDEGLCPSLLLSSINCLCHSHLE